MTAAQQITLIRLVTEHPGDNVAQIAHLASARVEDTEYRLWSLEHRGVIERCGNGWQRRRSAVRA